VTIALAQTVRQNVVSLTARFPFLDRDDSVVTLQVRFCSVVGIILFIIHVVVVVVVVVVEIFSSFTLLLLCLFIGWTVVGNRAEWWRTIAAWFPSNEQRSTFVRLQTTSVRNLNLHLVFVDC
jgi:hypothetical protein